MQIPVLELEVSSAGDSSRGVLFGESSLIRYHAATMIAKTLHLVQAGLRRHS
jgi:hypothetical protein